MKRNIRLISFIIIIAMSSSLMAQIGDPAPDFTVTDTKGKTHKLYDYLTNGKKVFLDFFFTTCGPCQYYSPQVNLAYTKYGCNQGDVFFMAIDLNNNDAQVDAYDVQYSVEFPAVSGLQGGGNEVIKQYKVDSYPRFYVIDSTKKIIDVIDPPTLQVIDFHFGMLGIPVTECNVATHEQKDKTGIFLYPNPATDNVNVGFLNEEDKYRDWNYNVSDAIGNIILTGQLNDNPINIEGLHGGVYILDLTNKDRKYLRKLVVKQ